MLRAKRVLKRYIRDVDEVDEKLQSFFDDPSVEGIHDLRTAIRRLDATLSILPKRVRRSRRAKKTLRALDRLMKESARLRDWDTIGSRLSSHPASPARDELIQVARKRRWESVSAVRKAADAVRTLPPPKLVPDDLSGPSLRKRFDDVVRSLASKIDGSLPVVLRDQRRIRELHTLRKDCKKLRYVLELASDRRAERTVSTLESWQDVLGAIRDSDVTIQYLRSRPKTPEAERILSEEARLRRENYDRFARRRRVPNWTAALS